jgi:predicted nucleic acid-binding protein
MVKALFDTNVLIDYLRGVPEAGAELARYDDVAISIVSWMEVMVGAPRQMADPTRAFLGRFELVGLDREIAETAVEIRQAHGMKLPDAIVWASARCQGRLLVTRDVKDFPPDEPGVRAPYVLKRG